MPRLSARPADTSSSRDFVLSTDASLQPLQSVETDQQYTLPPFLKGEHGARDGDGNHQGSADGHQASHMEGEVVGQLSSRMEVLEHHFSKQETLIRELFDIQSKSLKSTMTGLLEDFGHDTQCEICSEVRQEIKSMLSERTLKSPWSSSDSIEEVGQVRKVKSEKSENMTFLEEETIPIGPMGSYSSFTDREAAFASCMSTHSEGDSAEGGSVLNLDEDDTRLSTFEAHNDPNHDDCCSRCLLALRSAMPKEPRSQLPIRATQFLNLISRSRTSTFDDVHSLPSEWWSIERIVRSFGFMFVTSSLIALNAIYMGISTDNEMHRQTQRFSAGREHETQSVPERSTENVDTIFAVGFVIELLLRIWGYGCVFFCGSEWAWNLFDATIVLASLAQVCLAPFFYTAPFKVVRIVRLIRVLSALRKVPCLRKLEHMLVAVFNTLPALAPAVLLLVLMMYVFVVFFMQGLVDYLISVDPRDADPGLDDLVNAFGSVTNALETLFLSVVGGRNWDGLLVALRRVGPLYEITFPLYVGFVTFAVLNILTGIFVDAAQQFSSMDRELAVELQVDKEKEYVKGLMNLFAEADVDKSGTLTWDEFMGHFESNEVRAYLKGMDLNVTSAKKIFNLIDGDNTGEIGIQAFLETCLQLRGSAQVVDIVIMRSDMENMIEQKMNNMLDKVTSLKMLTTKAFRDMNRSRAHRSTVSTASRQTRQSVRVGHQGSLASSFHDGYGTAAGYAVGQIGSSASMRHLRSTASYMPATRSTASYTPARSEPSYSMLSPTIRTLSGNAGGPVDLGSYGAYKADGSGITGMRNTLLQEHNEF